MENYQEILDKQKELLPNDIKWWPNFLYHFTDVHNASHILYEGFIWSRKQAEEMHVMMNDNASYAVISSTNQDNKCYGRLYFRPMTPTQYHNEGYKPLAVRNKEIDANCPVPIFLCLGANATLNLSGTCFAEMGIAGHRHNICSGIEAFKQLNFQKIYHNGWYPPEEGDIKYYRQSEVIRENGFPVEPLLKGILCRSEAERETLLFLLSQYSMRLYNTYKGKVLYNPKSQCFFNNGIFVKMVQVLEDRLLIEFNDPEQRMTKQEHVDIEVQVDVLYKRLDGSVVNATTVKAILDYCNVRKCEYIIAKDKMYDLLRVKILIDENVMYENEINVREITIF